MKKLFKFKNGGIVRKPFTYLVTTELETKWYWYVLRFLRLKKQRDEFEIVFSYNCFKKNDLLSTSTHSNSQLKVIKALL
jgi:hypothetical protein